MKLNLYFAIFAATTLAAPHGMHGDHKKREPEVATVDSISEELYDAAGHWHKNVTNRNGKHPVVGPEETIHKKRSPEVATVDSISEELYDAAGNWHKNVTNRNGKHPKRT